MVGGTTSSVQSMVLSACKRGEKIILPRNVHRSVINALVLGGAIPIYVNPIHQNFHSPGMGCFHNLSEIGADSIVCGIVHQHRHRVRMLLHGPLQTGELHAQSNAQPPVHFRVHIDGDGSPQNQSVDDTPDSSAWGLT